MSTTQTAPQTFPCDPRLVAWDNPGLGIRCHLPENHDGQKCESGPAFRFDITRDERRSAVASLGIDMTGPCPCGVPWDSHDEGGSFLSSDAGHRWLTMCGKRVR